MKRIKKVIRFLADCLYALVEDDRPVKDDKQRKWLHYLGSGS